MRSTICAAVLLLCCALARADYAPTSISWMEPGCKQGWIISSNEDLWVGRTHTSYPLTYLVDDDPATAWVFSGKDRYGTRQYNPFHHHPGLGIEAKRPVALDSIALMNGYNKSPELFAKNDRITKVRLYSGETRIASADLPDEMGWHTIHFPRQKVRQLRIEFVRIERGTIDDICVSGLALWDGENRVDMHMPKVVKFTEGSECG